MLDARQPMNLRRRVDAVVEDPRTGNLFVAGFGGLWTFDVSKKVISRDQLPDNDPLISQPFIRALHRAKDGALWIGSGLGLSRFDPRMNPTKLYQVIPSRTSVRENSFGEVLEDPTGLIWAGHYWVPGLEVFDPQTEQFRLSGTLWIGTKQGGLNRLDRKTGKFTSWKSLVAGREFSSPWSICEDRQGNFWIGERTAGLHLFDRGKGRSIRSFTDKDGLASNSVGRIFEDGSGRLWIATMNGLSRFDPRSRRFNNYSVEDGLPDNFLLVRGLKTRDGRIILGGRKGPTVFHPDSIKDDPVAPQVVISNVSLFNRPDEKLTLDGYVPELKEIGLSYNQNDLRFDYVGLQFSEPARNRYKYMLENYDRDWVDAGTQRNATYTNLDPGEYTFRVKAANRDGIWNEEGASIRIIITPPWWKTVWAAYGSYGVLIVAVLYSVRRYEKKRDQQKQQAELDRVESEKRLQQEFSKQLIETQEAERKRVASELHDSLGQHLLIVNNELQLYQQGKGENDPDIQRTTSIVKDAIKEVREIASNLHPHHLEKLGLRAAVEAMIEQVSRSAPVKFNAVIADVDNKLSMQAKINLYRVLQEAIANIVRHSGAAKASITIREADNAVQAIIEDNGKGFVQGSSQGGRQGFGLKSMTERMNLVGGTIAFDSTPGKGTKIQIAIPIHN
jgi:signal transduction histidine kinase/sugar lactone lactonase YvrE